MQRQSCATGARREQSNRLSREQLRQQLLGRQARSARRPRPSPRTRPPSRTRRLRVPRRAPATPAATDLRRAARRCASTSRVSSCSDCAKYDSRHSSSLVLESGTMPWKKPFGLPVSRFTTSRPLPSSGTPSGAALNDAMPRTRWPSVHWIKSSFSGPSPCSCSDTLGVVLRPLASSSVDDDAFAEQRANRGRVVVRRDDLLPRLLRGARARRGCRCPRARRSALRSSLAPSCLRSASLTCCGFALPREAFMTWPTRKPSTCSLPARNCSTCAGFAAITSATSLSMLAESEICDEPALLDDLVDGAFAAPQGFEHFLGDLARDRAVGDLVEQRSERCGRYASSARLPSRRDSTRPRARP